MKSIAFGMVLKKIEKIEIFLVTRPPTCLKFDPCFWFSRKDKERYKSEFVTIFVRVIVLMTFM